MKEIICVFRTVTPLFMEGADPYGKPELRAPSFKSAMRYWYRALDPHYKANESKIFGSTDEGRGELFSLRINGEIEGKTGTWNNDNFDKLTRPNPNCPFKPVPSKWNVNGIRYLAYGLDEKVRGVRQQRSYISPHIDIKITLGFRQTPRIETKKAIIASLWLLGHIGGLGSRSRRGFGTTSLQPWTCSWDECSQMPVAHGSITAEKWFEIFKKGIETLKSWYPGNSVPDHTVLFGDNMNFCLCSEGESARGVNGNPFDAWQLALNEAGYKMQSFRQRQDFQDPNSDYKRVKEHLTSLDPKVAAANTKIDRNQLTHAPDRARFGLPLTIRYGSMRYPRVKSDGKPLLNSRNRQIYHVPETTFSGPDKDHDRSASPIHIRVVEIAGKCHPFFIRLDAPLVPSDTKIREEYKNEEKNITLNHHYIPTDRLLNEFWTHIETAGDFVWVEV